MSHNRYSLGRLLSGGLFLFASSTLWAGTLSRVPLSEAENAKVWLSDHPEILWIQGERELVFVTDEAFLNTPDYVSSEEIPFSSKQLYLVCGRGALPEGSRVLTKGGRIRLVASPTAPESHDDHHGKVEALAQSMVLSETLPFAGWRWRNFQAFTPVDGNQWFQDVETLATFNRYSYGTGIDQAKLWLLEQLAAIPGLTFEEMPFSMSRGPGTNIIATIPGKSRPDEIYIVGAHYDSTSERPSQAAPGAEDNASGAAGVLALARVIAAHPPESTVVFALFSGEEQGLYGSKALVKRYQSEGKASQIKLALIMDMIAYTGDSELDLLLETSRITSQKLSQIQSLSTDPELVIRQTYNYWGSDHEPFLDNSLPAILFIEDDYDDYPSYHRTTDTIDKIGPELGTKILQLMATSLQSWIY